MEKRAISIYKCLPMYEGYVFKGDEVEELIKAEGLLQFSEALRLKYPNDTFELRFDNANSYEFEDPDLPSKVITKHGDTIEVQFAHEKWTMKDGSTMTISAAGKDEGYGGLIGATLSKEDSLRLIRMMKVRMGIKTSEIIDALTGE